MTIILDIHEDSVSGDLNTDGIITKRESLGCSAMLIDMASRILHMSVGMEDTEFAQVVMEKATIPRTEKDGG